MLRHLMQIKDFVSAEAEGGPSVADQKYEFSKSIHKLKHDFIKRRG